MRPIKFRAWDKHKKELIPSVTVLAPVYNQSDRYSGHEIYISQSGDYEIMQFTGLKDKAGVEVYEGDILKLCEEDWSDYADLIQKVEWIPRWASFDLNPGTDGEYSSIIEIQENGSFEVIGNIHQHPELLEKK